MQLSYRERALSIGAPHSQRFGMSVQTFGFSQSDGRRGDAANSFARYFLARNDAEVIQNAESAADAGHRPGGQHVIGPRNVIPGGLGREFVEENRSRILHQWRQGRR